MNIHGEPIRIYYLSRGSYARVVILTQNNYCQETLEDLAMDISLSQCNSINKKRNK